MIELHDIVVQYPGQARPALDATSLRIRKDETLVLLGGSGSGKSTLLKAILRLVPLQQGRIAVDGTDIAAMDRIVLRRTIGMVFQQIALFPHLTILENIALPLRAAGVARSAREARAKELLALTGLEPAQYAQRYPHQLSGGQQQRAGVARALAPEPPYLLMDEPFGALDALTRRHLQDEVKMLRERLNITILFVTHDVMEATSLGDRIAVMDQGRIAQLGTAVELMDTPQSQVVQSLVSTPLAELRHFVRDSVR